MEGERHKAQASQEAISGHAHIKAEAMVAGLNEWSAASKNGVAESIC